MMETQHSHFFCGGGGGLHSVVIIILLLEHIHCHKHTNNEMAVQLKLSHGCEREPRHDSCLFHVVWFHMNQQEIQTVNGTKLKPPVRPTQQQPRYKAEQATELSTNME